MRVIAADWSGARAGEARHLWIAEWDPEAATVVAVGPASRARAVARLLDAAGPDLVVGLDFNFSFPAWWLDACGVASAPALWADAGRLERWLADCPPPFWGRPGRRRPGLDPEREFRHTELAAPRRPKSVFQIGGAGAVGTASLRGMPALARLRDGGFAVWPFDDPSPGVPLVVEAWPRLALGSAVKTDPEVRARWLTAHLPGAPRPVTAAAAASDDAFDAVAAAVDLAARGRAWHRATADPVVRREGWISGVGWPPQSAAR